MNNTRFRMIVKTFFMRVSVSFRPLSMLDTASEVAAKKDAEDWEGGKAQCAVDEPMSRFPKAGSAVSAS